MKIWVVLSVVLVVAMFQGCAVKTEDLSENETQAIIDQIIKSQKKIGNLHVVYKITQDDQFKSIHFLEEWGFSGEKKYKKFHFSSDVDSPLNERFAMGVWDEKYFKLYDSGANNGSVRGKYDPKDPQSSFDFASIYSRFFGTYQIGSMSKLLEENPIKQWHVELLETGSKVRLSCNLSKETTAKWIIRLDKNCLVEKFEKSTKNLVKGKTIAMLELIVSEFEEVEPGIWLPVRAYESVNINGKELKNHIEVEKVNINNPEIEKVFDFEFPIGSKYYDYRIEKAVTVKH